MAFTRIRSTGITTTDNYEVGVITATKFVGGAEITSGNITGAAATFSGNVSIAGTLTYMDVTNVDSVGVGTFQSNVQVGAGISVVGVSTFSDVTNVAGELRANGNLKISNVGPKITLVDTNNDDDFEIKNNDGVFTVRDATNSVDRLAIDSDGKVGIGTVSPSKKFEVYHSGLVSSKIKGDVAGGLGAELILQNVNPAANGYTEIQFQDAGTNVFSKLRGFNLTDGSNNGYLSFYTSSATEGLKERVRITDAGKVGIGTDIPANTLHLDASGGSTIRLTRLSSNASNNFQLSHDGTTASVSSSQDILFNSGGFNERLRITSAGSIGINSTSPDRRFTINQDATCRMNLKSLSNSTAGIEFGDEVDHNAGYIVYDNTDHSMQVGVGTGKKLHIDSSGLIANNNRTPSSYGSPNLLISGTDSTLTLMGDGSTNSTSYTGIKFRVAGASTGDYTKAGIFSRREGGYNDLSLIFALDTVADATSVSIADEKMRITSAGKVGIGTITPAKTLDVYGSFQVKDSGGKLRFLVHEDDGQFQVNQSVASWTNTNHDPMPLIKWGWKSGTGNYTYTSSGGNSATTSQMAYVISESHGFKVGKSGYDGTDGDVLSTAEYFRITNAGKVLIGHTASRNVGNVTSQMQLEGTDSAAGISITRNSDNAHAPYISLAKTRTGAVGGNVVIQDGDKCGEIRFSGADGTDISNNAASIIGAIDGTPGGNDTPGRLMFSTTPDGGVAALERLRITSSGAVALAGNRDQVPPTSYDDLTGSNQTGLILGSSGITDAGIMLRTSSTGTGRIYFGDNSGDEAARKQGHIEYHNDGDSMRFGTDGTERLRIDSTGDVRFAGTNLTDSTNKNVNLTAPSFDTDEEDVNLIQVENESGMNQITFGGGTAALNAATIFRFMTASAVNTTTGTERLRIDANGRLHTGYVSNFGADQVNVMATNGGGISIAQNNSGNAGTGTTIGTLSFQAYHSGQNHENAEAKISAIPFDTHTGSSASTDLVFYTKPDSVGPGSAPSERLRINANGLVFPTPGGGTIMGTWKYRQTNQSQNYEHKILGPYGNILSDDTESNAFFYIEIAVMGTGTTGAWCEYHVNWNSGEIGTTLTHVRGNSSASSNRPYMVLDSNTPCWKMDHSTAYPMDIKVRLMGGKSNVFMSTNGTYGANP